MNEDFMIPEWHKEEAPLRIKNFKEDDYIPLEIALQQIRRENKSKE